MIDMQVIDGCGHQGRKASLTCPIAIPRVAGDGFQQKLVKGHLSCLGVVLKWNSAQLHTEKQKFGR